MAVTPNIVWIHSHFLYWMGGTKYIYEVVKRLSKKHNVLVIVERTNSLVVKQYRELGVPLITLNSATSIHPYYWLGLPFFIPRRVLQIKKILVERGLESSNTTLVSSMFPMNAVANQLDYQHVQLCYEPFAFFFDREFIKYFSPFKKIFIHFISGLYRHIDIKAVAQADSVVTLNQVTQAAILEQYQVSASVIYAGVDSKRFKPFVPPDLAKLYNGRPVVIHSTDYSPVKGTDRVIKAIAIAAEEHPKVLLLITSTISNPKAENELKQLAKSLRIEKNVRFMGFVSLEELPHYYSLATVMVQGSNSLKSGTTSMALPVKEAMSCETPAIRPDMGGEDVVDGQTGFLVDPVNTVLLAEKIAYILSHPKVGKQMGKAARQSIVKKYTWEKTVKRLEKML